MKTISAAMHEATVGGGRSQVMEHVTGKNIKSTLEAQVSKEAHLMTDGLNVYAQAGQAFASHEAVEHGRGEYTRAIYLHFVKKIFVKQFLNRNHLTKCALQAEPGRTTLNGD